MTVRTSVVCCALGVSAMFTAGAYVVTKTIIVPAFAEIERAEAGDDLARCRGDLLRGAEFAASNSTDYGAWDDTYAFIEDGNEEYQRENLIPETFKNLKLNLLMFVRLDGTMVWGQLREDGGGDLIDAPELLQAIARPDHLLVAHGAADSQTSGVLMTERGPMLVGSSAITTSNRDGAVRGAVIMARFISPDVVARLADRTQVVAHLHPLRETPTEFQDAVSHLMDGSQTYLDDRDRTTLVAHALIDDVFHRPALLLTVELPRTVMLRGQALARVGILTTAVCGAVSSFALWLVLSRVVVRPITRLTNHALRVGATGDLRSRLGLRSQSEVGVLAREFDHMVERLAESRRQLTDVARQAGKAEVATDVLHNVGNVLNGVGVSVGLIGNKLRSSEVDTVGQIAHLLSENRAALAEFLTQNERGKRLPEFVAQLADQLQREQEGLLAEVQAASDALEHVRALVDLQQRHGSQSIIREDVEPAALVEQALSLCAPSLKRHGINVATEPMANESVLVDRHQIIQIVVNLITNAASAIKAQRPERPEIQVRSCFVDGETGRQLCIEVSDNGDGIAPENLARVFSFGFSTRPDGHGYGLHAAANAARTMGGSLAARSDGVGRGSTFTLLVPSTAGATA